MSNTALIVIGAIVVIAIIAFVLLMRKSQSVSLDTSAPLPVAKPAPAPKPVVAKEGHGITDSAAAAMLDIATPVLGVDAHPDLPSDELTRIKGLGPKAATALNGLGIHRYAQLAALDSGQAAELDSRMGAFKGRLDRDRWIEQARFLEQDDVAGFEAQFGKLG